ncbi:MAG: crotonase/enoyl-CoA hydratase family protein [Silicimonas sp.]|nr:crotonase/enoyl-CoA hydratase family protein [Silicimonas sp.]
MSTEITSTFFEIIAHGAVRELRMNRPDKANGMNMEFWTELPQIMAALDADPEVRAVLLTGAGKNFSGGMDLACFGEVHKLLNEEPGRAAFALRNLILKLQSAFNALETTRLPVIAAIHGACIGGAVDMIAACDIRIATEDAKFSVEEIHIGMTADVGTLQRLPKLIPLGVVNELAMTGRRFTTQEAKDWGLINTIHADADAVQAAGLELAQSIAAKSPLAISGVKQAVTYARDHAVADGLNQIATWNAGMLRAEDLMKAMQAKMMKSEADFADLLKPV